MKKEFYIAMQIKHWALLATFSLGVFCYSGSTLAVGSIHGQVRDQNTGKPVPFASISVKNCNSIEAMNDGAFIIDCPSGSYSLIVNAENYQSFTFDSFYLSDNEFLKKDVMLTPAHVTNTQQDYTPAAAAPQDYYNNEPQNNPQDQYDSYPADDNYSASNQQPAEEEPSRTGTALGNLMAKMAGNRLDTHMQKRQQRKQPAYNNNYASNNSNDSYYTNNNGNDGYYETDNSGNYYDSGSNNNYYEGVGTAAANSDEHYYPYDNSNTDNSYSNETYNQDDYYSDTNSRTKHSNRTQQQGSAVTNNRKPQPGLTNRTNLAQIGNKTRTNNPRALPVRKQAKHLNTSPIVITNNASAHIIAGEKKSYITLKGNGLSSVKGIKVIDPEGRGDSNILTQLDRKKSSDTFLAISLEASLRAKTGSGFYRLQLDSGSDKIILPPNKVNIIVGERITKAPAYNKPVTPGKNSPVFQRRK